ncbi:MAG: DUF3943 domain-containing protein [Prevotella sp.]|nr:DUF3943 domain-containing protein [Prevotella sp.]
MNKSLAFSLAIILFLVTKSNISIHADDTIPKTKHDLAFTISRDCKDSIRAASLNIGLLGGSPIVRGLQLNLMTSFSRDETHGVQISGLSNLSGNLRGTQLSLFSNVSLSPFSGVQLSGVTNISRGVKRGLQLSLLMNTSSSFMRGAQLSIYNYADSLSGTQIGIVNLTESHPKGVQIGIVNYSRDSVAHKVGLINISPRTDMDAMFFIGNSSKFNLAFRFRNKTTYSIIGIGTHYLGLDEDFSGSIYYRLGQYIRLGKKWYISGDAGFFHVETFREEREGRPERLYSLQLRANTDFQINDRFGVFASIGYGTTRYYHKNKEYRNRLILEAGFTVSYDKKRSHTQEERAKKLILGDSIETPLFLDDAIEKKRPWLAVGEVIGINLLVNGFDRFIMNADYAKINLHTIHRNFKKGFVWDNDQFSTNLFAHPYHGGLYFNAARSNGMNFWTSIPFSFGGSLMWEMFCETEPPAINDLIATTVGGVCIGEITYRVSDLVYDDSQRGFLRVLRELAGAVLCPIKEFNRILTGKAWRVNSHAGKYHDYEKLPVELSIALGDRYLADEGGLFRGENNPYIDITLNYGDALDCENNKPYDSFLANITFGLSANQPIISSVHLTGKLWGTQMYEGKEMTAIFGLFQHFNYYDSEAVKNGTSRVPYRISEAAAFGPGIIYRFPKVGNTGDIEQSLFLDAILLGGSLSDYYHVIDRDYNLGSGYSMKAKTTIDFPKFGKFSILADFYNIFTWQGYEKKDLTDRDPLYTNAQGDKGSAILLVITPRLQIYLKKLWSIEIFSSYYLRSTKYRYHEDVRSETFELRAGVCKSF